MCQNIEVNDTFLKKILWITTAKDLLNCQAAVIQKSIDNNVLHNWRYNYKKFFKKQNNTLNYSLDVPFGLHLNNSKTKDNYREINDLKLKYLTSENFKENFTDFIESLKKLDDTKSEQTTPLSEQKEIEAEIEKITVLQRKLQNLKLCNATTVIL